MDPIRRKHFSQRAPPATAIEQSQAICPSRKPSRLPLSKTCSSTGRTKTGDFSPSPLYSRASAIRALGRIARRVARARRCSELKGGRGCRRRAQAGLTHGASNYDGRCRALFAKAGRAA